MALWAASKGFEAVQLGFAVEGSGFWINGLGSRFRAQSRDLVGFRVVYSQGFRVPQRDLHIKDSFRWVVYRWVPPYKAHLRLV